MSAFCGRSIRCRQVVEQVLSLHIEGLRYMQLVNQVSKLGFAQCTVNVALRNLIKEGVVSYVYEPKGIYRRTRKPENLHVKRYFLRSVCDVIVGDSC